MLKYSIKLNESNFKRDKIVWREKYLSPDLSYVSGVTSPSYHLEKFDYLASTNSINNTDNTLKVDCHNVIRKGFIVMSGKTFEIKHDTYHNFTTDEDIEYKYVFINGKYFYEHELRKGVSGYTIDNLLNAVKAVDVESGEDAQFIYDHIEVEKPDDGEPLKIDAVSWIEDDFVEIDGVNYIYTKDEVCDQCKVDNGVIKYTEDGEALEASAITDCDEIICYPYKSATEYEEVTKVKLTKEDSVDKDFEKITLCKYYYFVTYKNHHCMVKQIVNGDSFSFVCSIPKYVLSANTMDGNLEEIDFPLYYIDGSLNTEYDICWNNGNTIDSDHADVHGVYDLNDLKDIKAFIKIDDAYFDVSHNILSSNDGREIVVYLNDSYAPLNVGDKIVFSDDTTDRGFQSLVYDQNDYDANAASNDGILFILYNGKKYLVQANVQDKVVINDTIQGYSSNIREFDIDYRNGKVKSADCFVNIDGEEVPFFIKNIDEGEYEAGQLRRYGLIVSGCSCGASATTGIYDIKPYSGVTINGETYIIQEYENDIDIPDLVSDSKKLYANLPFKNKYPFVISEIMGSSMYVCKPSFDESDFPDEFMRLVSSVICEDVVSNQRIMALSIENKIFGEDIIEKELGFKANSTPTSTDDFYNLFDDLKVYVNSGYIHIPLNLDMNVANNYMQDDIVTKNFYEVEKEKAINPIVDMEKDVYLPKYIVGDKYEGSKTVFNPIEKINLNFHFRTRNLESWKVNDGYNNYETSGDTEDNTNSTDNWFITDFHPYKNILNESGDTLQETSDLMGLLYFTNDDIFYQKSKVAKTFARLSFYDSTDPQTQSLLATSCVFIDEHKLYKRFIDNSRKNVNDYGFVEEPQFKKENGYTVVPKEDITNLNKTSKISVNTEFLGKKKNKIDYSSASTDSSHIVIDETKRISSKMEIVNKYKTDTSSEGFYLYIFREYTEKLHPKPIYMKIEFNHAGIGKTIPFVIPMHWREMAEGSNKMVPERRLFLKNKNDVKEMKNGMPLAYVYAQTYIPLYAVYDFINKEYAYVFDSRYIDVVDDEVNINLFEMKIMEEVWGNKSEEAQKEIQKDITQNNPIRAIVNVNTEQFDITQFNKEVE
jgi:hypothetical protein